MTNFHIGIENFDSVPKIVTSVMTNFHIGIENFDSVPKIFTSLMENFHTGIENFENLLLFMHLSHYMSAHLIYFWK